MKFFLCALAVFFSTHVFSQSYKPLQSVGPIPHEFVTRSSEKYQVERQNIEESDRKTRKTKNKFFLQSTFNTDNLLKSGYILFNDPITEYVNKVAAEVLKQNPEIASNLRFYTLKSTIVNAFSTNEGLVLISLGLMAQVENEAQLAFVLCHEIAHYMEKHALQNFLRTEEIIRGKGLYKELSFDEKTIERLKYSKENEIAADKKGLQYYLNTKYSLESLDGAFDVLQYSHLPIDNVPFDFALFEGEHFSFPEDYKLAEVNPINTDDNEDDEECTHPSITKRRNIVSNVIENESKADRREYLFTKVVFDNAQKDARYELMRLYLLNRRYETAIYHGAILLSLYPDDTYILESMGRALYALANYCGTGDFGDVHLSAKKTEGYLHQTVHLFESLNKKSEECIIIALRYMLSVKDKFPERQAMDPYIENLVKRLVVEYNIKWDYFSSTTLKEAMEKMEMALSDTTEIPEKNLSKYDKIKKQSAENPDQNYIKYALAKHKDNEQLQAFFDKADREKENPEKLTYKQMKRNRLKGHALNIDTVTFFAPIYAFVDERKKETYRYLESEDGQIDLTGRIEAISKKLKLRGTVLDVQKLSTSDIDNFNDYAFVSEYIHEQFNHPDEIRISTVDPDRVDAFVEKYGSPYVSLIALIYIKRNVNLAGPITYSVLFPFVLPYTLPKMISYGKTCYYVSLLYNIKTNELIFSEAENIYASNQNHLLNSHIYYTLKQITTKRKRS